MISTHLFKLDFIKLVCDIKHILNLQNYHHFGDYNINIALFYNAFLGDSKGEMRKLVQGGGVSLNKEKLAAFDQVITTADLLDEKYLLVQRGKKNYYLIIAK